MIEFIDMDTYERVRVLQNIDHERSRQIDKWGEQHHPNGTDVENAGRRDFYRARCDQRARDGEGTWWDILLEETYEAAAEIDPETLRKELVQVAAVCVAWIEDLDSHVQ